MDGTGGRADAAARARAYYRALDEHDYDGLRDLLAPGFVQERPDLTLDGRDRFVQFVREERPQRDTAHAVDAVYVPGGDAAGDDRAEAGDEDVAVRGRLLSVDGALVVRFVDVFTDGDGGFERLETYTR